MWIESHQSLLNHRKTGRLSRRLGIGRVTAIGYLHIFWWWCLDNAPEGDLTGVDVEDIAQGACWEGDPAAFLEALIYSEFIDRTDDGRAIVHDWHEFAGKLIERRKKDADRKRETRQAQDIQQMSAGCPQDGVRTACVPNLTEPNRTVTNGRSYANGTGRVVARNGKDPFDPTEEVTPPPRDPLMVERERVTKDHPHWLPALEKATPENIRSRLPYQAKIWRKWMLDPASAPPLPPPPLYRELRD